MTGFRVAPGGVQEREGSPARPHDPRQDHRRRPAGRGLRRPGRHHGPPLARGAGLPGRDALGQPARDGGRASRPCASCKNRASTRISRTSASVLPPGCPKFSRATACRHERQPRLDGRVFPHRWSGDQFGDAKRSDTALYGRFFHAMLERGVYLAPSQFEAGFLSTAHQPADVDRTLEIGRRRADGGICRPAAERRLSSCRSSAWVSPITPRRSTCASVTPFRPHKMGEALIALRDYEAVREALMLQTCGRLEIYAELEDYEEGVKQIRAVPRQLPPRRRRGHGLVHVHAARESGRSTISSASATGLDSMLIGEAEILAQVKDAFIQGQRAQLARQDAALALPRSDQRRQGGAHADRRSAATRSRSRRRRSNFAEAARRRAARQARRRDRRRQDGLAGRAAPQARRLRTLTIVNRTHQRAREIVESSAPAAPGSCRDWSRR